MSLVHIYALTSDSSEEDMERVLWTSWYCKTTMQISKLVQVMGNFNAKVGETEEKGMGWKIY